MSLHNYDYNSDARDIIINKPVLLCVIPLLERYVGTVLFIFIKGI